MSIESTLSHRMTMAKEFTPEKRFVTTYLPWVIAVAALLLYLATRDTWRTIAGSEVVGVVSGWSFQGDLTHPLFWLLTLPFRLLPESWIPAALNLFSAVCGALTLALLVRCVALMPHDRTEDQRLREQSPFSILTIRSAWLPPVLAGLGLALQLTFWEQASGISSEMLDVLVFAYVVRCLLEFRFDGGDSWLLRGTLVFAAGMSNNWAMIFFAPLFLTALIWLKGVSFFNSRFLTRVFFVGSAGLCVYLIQPLATAISGSEYGFWSALKANLSNQKNFLWYFIVNKDAFYLGDRPLWIIGLPSLLPVLALSIRWPATFGDQSKLGQQLASFAFNVLHAIFLVVCAWTLLDPRFSPRNYGPQELGYLPLYFLTALSLGYYAGYFLLCFGGAPPARRLPVTEPEYVPALNFAVTAAIWLLLLFVPFMQVFANWKLVGSGGSAARNYAQMKIQALPKGAVVLGDNPWDLALAQQCMIEQGIRKQYLLLNTAAMPTPAYHRFLAHKHPGAWDAKFDPPSDRVTVELAALIKRLSLRHELFYLHPSFGYYFEEFYLQPAGPVLKMVPCDTNSVLQAPLSADLIARNKAFWSGIEQTQLDSIADIVAQSTPWKNAPALLARLAERLTLARSPKRDTLQIGASYSRALNFWGVQLQRNGRTAEAASYFERSMQLNPENLSADINLQCGQNLLAGKDPKVSSTPELVEKKEKRRGLVMVLNWDGPLDEPMACLETGAMFSQGGQFRQATEEYKRVVDFYPNDLFPRVKLAEGVLSKGATRQGLEIISEIHRRGDDFGLNTNGFTEVLRLELAAHLMNKDVEAAERVVKAALDKYPGQQDLLSTASHVYLTLGYSSNAVSMLEEQLKLRPDDPGTLINLGYAWIRLTNYAKAIPPLTRVIDRGTNSSPESVDAYYRALYNRAVAHEKNNQLDLAQKDFEQLQKALPKLAVIAYNLAEVGDRKKDTNYAIQNYERFLSLLADDNQPTNTPAVSNVVERLSQLKRSKQ